MSIGWRMKDQSMEKRCWEPAEGSSSSAREEQMARRGNYFFRSKVRLLTLMSIPKNWRQYRSRIYKWRTMNMLMKIMALAVLEVPEHPNQQTWERLTLALPSLQLWSIYSIPFRRRKHNTMRLLSMMRTTSKRLPRYKRKSMMGMPQRKKTTWKRKGKYNLVWAKESKAT